ncbi:MAG: hypothetical protein KatS3mg065_1276 [Chloroflexota bacterium]|nr:MAG: hypothetical protein KatS3mg065_1276 [Chloroflexota bacterium]HWP63876.1 hypothetical protein [Candidatus Binatia bacterium]
MAETGFFDLDRLLELVRRTRELLDVVVDEGTLPEGGADYLAEATLPHIEGIEAGFVGWVRSEHAGIDELRYLLTQVAHLDRVTPETEAERRAALAEAILERSLGRGRPRLQRARARDLIALTHARVVLGYLPRVPDERVRYPAGFRTYADIPVPRGPAELAERIRELERQLWRTATGRPPAPLDPAFKRTYGFFDAADQLGRRAFGLPA